VVGGGTAESSFIAQLMRRSPRPSVARRSVATAQDLPRVVTQSFSRCRYL